MQRVYELVSCNLINPKPEYIDYAFPDSLEKIVDCLRSHDIVEKGFNGTMPNAAKNRIKHPDSSK
ncbi:hypothetical protein KI387_004397, partial [Taxus chinensis]